MCRTVARSGSCLPTDWHVWVSGFKYRIFLGVGFLRYGHVPLGNQKDFFVAIVFLSLKNAIETIKSLFFQTCSLEKSLLHAQLNA